MEKLYDLEFENFSSRFVQLENGKLKNCKKPCVGHLGMDAELREYLKKNIL